MLQIHQFNIYYISIYILIYVQYMFNIKRNCANHSFFICNLIQDAPQHAAWNRANQRRRNSRTLAKKLNNRPSPNLVLNKGIIKQDDYTELFNALPQTQPPTPTFGIENEIDRSPIVYEHTNSNSASISNISNGGTNINNNNNTVKRQKRVIYTNPNREEKLSFKIKQRPTIDEMKSRGLMYEDPKVPASLQNRKRELHRRRASRKLGMYYLYIDTILQNMYN